MHVAVPASRKTTRRSLFDIPEVCQYRPSPQLCHYQPLPESAEIRLALRLRQRGDSAPIRPETYCTLNLRYTTPIRTRLYGHPG